MKYEIMFIVRPDLEGNAVKAVATTFEKVLTDKKAKILSSKEVGQKELAYDIKKHKSGYYFIYQIEAHDTKAINEFDRLATLSEDILRHIVIKLED